MIKEKPAEGSDADGGKAWFLASGRKPALHPGKE